MSGATKKETLRFQPVREIIVLQVSLENYELTILTVAKQIQKQNWNMWYDDNTTTNSTKATWKVSVIHLQPQPQPQLQPTQQKQPEKYLWSSCKLSSPRSPLARPTRQTTRSGKSSTPSKLSHLPSSDVSNNKVAHSAWHSVNSASALLQSREGCFFFSALAEFSKIWYHHEKYCCHCLFLLFLKTINLTLRRDKSFHPSLDWPPPSCF